MSLLGVSVSHLGCRAVVISRSGGLVAERRRTYAAGTPPASETDRHPRAVYVAVRELIGETAEAARRDPVESVAFSSAGEVVVAVSNSGQPLSPIMVPGERFGSLCLRTLDESLGAESLFHITGRLLGGHSALPAICWLRDNDRQVFWDTWRFLPLGSLLSNALGGTATVDPSLASGTFCLDINAHHWSSRVLETGHVPKLKMPDIVPAGEPIGTVSATRAREFGLGPNTRIVQGGDDLACCALGAGVTGSGQALYRIGSSIDLAPCFAAIPITSMMYKRGLPMQPHVVPDLYLSQVRTVLGGRLLQWFIDQFVATDRRQAQREGASIYNRLLAEMPPNPSEMLIVPDRNPLTPGNAPPSLSVHGMSLSTTRGQLVQALLEATTYPMMHAQRQYADAGVSIRECRAAGPGASSLPWLQLVADMLGRPVVSTGASDAAAVGAAMLAGIGLGAFSSASEAIEAVARAASRFEPSAAHHAAYQKALVRYQQVTESATPKSPASDHAAAAGGHADHA